MAQHQASSNQNEQRDEIAHCVHPPQLKYPTPDQRATLDRVLAAARQAGERWRAAHPPELQPARKRATRYDHTWVIKKTTTEQAESIANDACALAANCHVRLTRSVRDQREPCFEPHEIHFNEAGIGGEDFVYPPNETENAHYKFPPGFGVCNTRAADYDQMVGATLLAIKHHLGDDVTITSSGQRWHPAWESAITLYAHTFPERFIPDIDSW